MSPTPMAVFPSSNTRAKRAVRGQETGMRWLKYSVGGKSHWGAVEGGNVTELEAGPFDGPAVRTGAVHRFADVTVEVPLIPRTMYCAGLNYIAHVSGSAEWLSA